MVIYSVHHFNGTSYFTQNIPELIEELSPVLSYQFSGSRELYDAFVGVCIAMDINHSNVFFDNPNMRVPLGYITAQRCSRYE